MTVSEGCRPYATCRGVVAVDPVAAFHRLRGTRDWLAHLWWTQPQPCTRNREMCDLPNRQT
eukprot:scaffold7_cov378-Prasinococcus_capsulatus_cf.AAC.12